MSLDDAKSWNFFNDHVAVGPSIGNVYTSPAATEASNSVTVGVINEPADGDTTCSTSDTNWLKAAAALWGYTSGPDLLCALGFTRDVNPSHCNDTTASTNDFKLAHDNNAAANEKDVDAFWKSLGNSSTGLGSITTGLYSLYFSSFTAGCGVVESKTNDTVNYTIQTFADGATTSKPTNYTIIDRTKNAGSSVRIYQDTNLTCQQLADKLKSATSDVVLAFGAYLSKGGSTVGAVCGEVGVTVDKSGKPCPVTPGDTSSSSCTVDGIGWIICPVVTFLAGVSDGIFGFLSDNFLNTSPELVSQGSDTYKAWSAMRTIANVAFVISFLIIIFSQLTGLGVSNYGVKKMLPRVIIAAVLVNVSFYICAIAIDLSNILGHSLKDLLTGLGAKINDATIGDTASNPLSGSNSLVNVAGSVLAVAGTAVAGYALIGSIVPVLLAAVVALLMIFFLLIGREVIIVLLIVLSPLAFVAYLLPNTETWFKRWRQTLVAMLMLFPIISVVYGVSSLTSAVIGSAFSANVSGGNGNLFGQIVGAAVLVIPLFAVPILLKKSLDGIPAVGKFMSGLSSRANGNLKKRIGESYKNSIYGQGRAARDVARQQFYKNRSAQRTDASVLGGILGRGTSALQITRNQKAQSAAVLDGAKASGLKEALIPLNSELDTMKANGRAAEIDDFLLTRARTGKTVAERGAAMHQLASMGRDEALRNLSRDTGVDQKALQEAIGANGGALVGKAPDLIKGGSGAFSGVSGEEMASYSKDTAAAHMSYLTDLYKRATAPGADPKTVTEYNNATKSFNSAVEDIIANPSLQAKFKGDNGNAMLAAMQTMPAGLQNSIHGLAAIQNDGKIR